LNDYLVRPRYDAIYQQSEVFGKAPRLVRRLSDDYPGVLLDIGCGQGRNVVPFAQRGWEVNGIDPSIKGLVSTLQKLQEVRAAYPEMKGAMLQCTDFKGYHTAQKFDLIMCMNVLHFMEDSEPFLAIERMQEMTKPGGSNLVQVFTDKIMRPEFKKFSFADGHLEELYASEDWEIRRYRRQNAKLRSGTQVSIELVVARKPHPLYD
jgi:tellurite methyltransferase